ncbi:hypothetical protein, partial [Rhizobium sp. BK661]|uniref:hypothetical protein n=1 Tax=Rhizobium sp. BK661 TaxID=2586991 RepID=UPI002167266C
PHRNPPLPPQIQQPKTAGANLKLDKTWGQGQDRRRYFCAVFRLANIILSSLLNAPFGLKIEGLVVVGEALAKFFFPRIEESLALRERCRGRQFIAFALFLRITHIVTSWPPTKLGNDGGLL